ncbi:hypothetical protein POX_e07234 [Penicillium oxalicum]|uniref:hypothetical protein n=1 Tax=Penicillium oxalicum TaxID=69781 RepID=UPI0020B6F3BF|nr:hypothetical protein POX_e07234 [Penicillium oxalicum]KAI2789204.1 hypothetical protein POX_e07234 [Penicillium oxalicum]
MPNPDRHHIRASVTSSQKAAQYALKHRDWDEDLHSCILEQLERNNMNNRANIMSFIEQFCDMATKENHLPYVRMMQRDILRVVDAVVPPDGSGAANVKHSVSEIEAALRDRDVNSEQYDLDNSELSRSGDGALSGSRSPRHVKPSDMRLDKRQIEQRIEEDRERNKRLRESMWAVGGGDQDEWHKFNDDLSDIDDDDLGNTEEEMSERDHAAAAMRGDL